MALTLEDLHISFQEIKPYWEDFSELRNLYLDHKPIIVGYVGNLYEVSLTGGWNGELLSHSYEGFVNPYGRFGNCSHKRFRINIFDLMCYKPIMEGTFDIAFPSTDCHAMPKVREAVRNAIIKVNMKSTDYYK